MNARKEYGESQSFGFEELFTILYGKNENAMFVQLFSMAFQGHNSKNNKLTEMFLPKDQL
jgi:hypothetical protein